MDRQRHKWNGKRVAPNSSFFRSSKPTAPRLRNQQLIEQARRRGTFSCGRFTDALRLEQRGWLQGRWLKKAEARRRYYRVTRQGAESWLRSFGWANCGWHQSHHGGRKCLNGSGKFSEDSLR